MSYALYYQPSLVSKQTTIEFKTLVLDADLEGLQQFPPDFFTNVTAKGKNWQQIRTHFRVVRQSIPILKGFQLSDKGIAYEKYNPDEKFEFVVNDLRNDSQITIMAKQIEHQNSKVELGKLLC